MPFDFVQVDAFTRRPLYGNPAAVVFDADAMSAETMQRVAREKNLSETVFMLAPTTREADYRVRIFTPMSELPFAGHPTIAAAHAFLARDPAGVTVFAERGDGGPVRLRARSFAPGEGVPEDPVCGSGNGSVVAFIARHKQPHDAAGRYVAEQGIELGRDGEVHASWDRDGDNLRIRIGGEAAVAASGRLHLSPDRR